MSESEVSRTEVPRTVPKCLEVFQEAEIFLLVFSMASSLTREAPQTFAPPRTLLDFAVFRTAGGECAARHRLRRGRRVQDRAPASRTADARIGASIAAD